MLEPPSADIPENETGSQKGKKKLVDYYGFTYVVRVNILILVFKHKHVAYIEDDVIHKFVRKIITHPFLPAADITRMFLRIIERVPATGKLLDLINYFQAQWIAHPTFSPRSWSVFNIAVRTNNFLEGNNNTNTKAGKQSLGIYRLIPELFREASLLPLQSRLIQEGPLGAYVRKSSTSRQEEILDVWRRYKDGDLSLTQVLSQCSVVHGPIL
ncbi:uncharacterized protein LOC124148303 [Haliotis rufescens]|uniref:uncharacterized protein LOC124148303 n=1 Tax=Haliotis rufescens TaxID=6454 RepID=UPI00201EF78D|nr:uncharacterized protein LOC124148303 [Haliotis rufescens]